MLIGPQVQVGQRKKSQFEKKKEKKLNTQKLERMTLQNFQIWTFLEVFCCIKNWGKFLMGCIFFNFKIKALSEVLTARKSIFKFNF